MNQADETAKEVAEARARLQARFGEGKRVGGKGKQCTPLDLSYFYHLLCLGQRVVQKKKPQANKVQEDKGLSKAVARFGKWQNLKS